MVRPFRKAFRSLCVAGGSSVTFQIRAVHLYNAAGDRRTLPFELNSVNIITGRSGTGKSSVVDIIDYCLGSGDYTVAAGVIRRTTRMYALELETESGIVISARPAPGEKRSTTTQMHISFRDPGSPPPVVADLAPNSDVESAIGLLSRILGIAENQSDVVAGTRVSFDATIRHALFFCVQAQGEIANREILFHDQGADFRPQAIRDVLPYFLGTVDPLFILKRGQLRILEREARELERRNQDERAIATAPGRAGALLSEAAALGLTEQPPELTRAAIIAALARVLEAETPNFETTERTDELASLLEAREQLRIRHSETRAELRRLQKLIKYENISPARPARRLADSDLWAYCA
jgi:hypothetical protein